MSLDIMLTWLSSHPLVAQSIYLVGVVLLSWLAYLVAKVIILKALTRLIQRSATQFDDILLRESVFHRLITLIPVLILYNFTYLVPRFTGHLQRFLGAIIAWIVILTLGAVITAGHEIYKSSAFAKRMDIKSYLQVVKLFVYLFGAIVIISLLIGRSPWGLLSGIGAMTAVLLLIFRDTLLSFVASLQISSNNLVRVGDWIEMPEFGADGDVIDIALHTVKVQNWDKTITMIPTHKLLETSFKNWRGMFKSGGRRIKRSIPINVSSVRLCDDQMLEMFEKFDYITDYIRQKRDEVARYNQERGVNTTELINGRRLTNLGTFRAYIEGYLRHHPQIRQDMTLMVRQLPPGALGLPIEIYVFINDTRWEHYEAIQADIFDHILAVVPEFGLSVFQRETGEDFRWAGSGRGR